MIKIKIVIEEINGQLAIRAGGQQNAPTASEQLAAMVFKDSIETGFSKLNEITRLAGRVSTSMSVAGELTPEQLKAIDLAHQQKVAERKAAE
jgi:hypothetical protein